MHFVECRFPSTLLFVSNRANVSIHQKRWEPVLILIHSTFNTPLFRETSIDYTTLLHQSNKNRKTCQMRKNARSVRIYTSARTFKRIWNAKNNISQFPTINDCIMHVWDNPRLFAPAGVMRVGLAPFCGAKIEFRIFESSTVSFRARTARLTVVLRPTRTCGGAWPSIARFERAPSFCRIRFEYGHWNVCGCFWGLFLENGNVWFLEMCYCDLILIVCH